VDLEGVMDRIHDKIMCTLFRTDIKVETDTTDLDESIETDSLSEELPQPNKQTWLTDRIIEIYRTQ
jgi:hypothetical protein